MDDAVKVDRSEGWKGPPSSPSELEGCGRTVRGASRRPIPARTSGSSSAMAKTTEVSTARSSMRSARPVKSSTAATAILRPRCRVPLSASEVATRRRLAVATIDRGVKTADVRRGEAHLAFRIASKSQASRADRDRLPVRPAAANQTDHESRPGGEKHLYNRWIFQYWHDEGTTGSSALKRRQRPKSRKAYAVATVPRPGVSRAEDSSLKSGRP